MSDQPISEAEWESLLAEASMVDVDGLSSLFEDDEEQFSPEDASEYVGWQTLPDWDTEDDDSAPGTTAPIVPVDVMGDAAEAYLTPEGGDGR